MTNAEKYEEVFCMNFAADHKMQDMSGELPYEE